MPPNPKHSNTWSNSNTILQGFYIKDFPLLFHHRPTTPFHWTRLPLAAGCPHLFQLDCFQSHHQALLERLWWSAAARKPRWRRGRRQGWQWRWWRAHRCPTARRSLQQQSVRSLEPRSQWSRKLPTRAPVELRSVDWCLTSNWFISLVHFVLEDWFWCIHLSVGSDQEFAVHWPSEGNTEGITHLTTFRF